MFLTFVTFTKSLGVPFRAEIIPFEPDADHAAEGKSEHTANIGSS